ncbi:TraB/GumN family protein, partial [Arthrospira platensis SPKY1]|nr:TraB/GumN family protein [Arthrospira platensis SPKY1]
MLWEISGNGIEKPSYLYGTIHMACELNFPEKLINAIETTEQLYLEINLDDPNLQRDIMQGMQMKNGQKISSMVSKETFEKMNDFFKTRLKMPLTMLEQTK